MYCHFLGTIIQSDRESAFAPGGLDLILMPGLGFTRQGARLGRGKGFYDTYLQKYRDKFGRLPLTVALAFYEQLVDEIPCSENDVPVDLVLFEDKKLRR